MIGDPPWNIGEVVRSEGRDPVDDPNQSVQRSVVTGLPSLDWYVDGLDGLILVGASDPALALALALSAIKQVAIMDWTRSRSVAVFSPTLSRSRVVRALLGALSRLDPRDRHFLTRDQARSWRGATDVLAAATGSLHVDDAPAMTVPLIAERLIEMGKGAPPLGLVVILDLEAIDGERVQTQLRALSRSLGRVPILATSRRVGGHGQRDGSPCVANVVIAVEAEPAVDLDAERAASCSAATGSGVPLAANLVMRWSPRTYRLEEEFRGDDRPPERG